MAQDIGTLLKRWAELRNMLQATEPVSGGPSEPAIEMLRHCISELYDALKVTWIPCEERMPARGLFVWLQLAYLADITIGQWTEGRWDNHWKILGRPGTYTQEAVIHWAEIAWPVPPAG